MSNNIYPDDAKRMSDTITMHAVAGSAGKYCVIALADGSSPNYVTFDTPGQAYMSVRWDRKRYILIHIPPDGMQPRECFNQLTFFRQLHDAGMSWPDPSDRIQPDITMPTLDKDRQRQIKLLTR